MDGDHRTARASAWEVVRGPRAAAAAFGAYLVVALPLLVLSLGRYMWFFRDDWFFLTDRELTDPGSLFEAHNGHWSTVPVVVFRVLYRIFGLDSYRPYQAAVVVVHLGVCVLVRVIARRVGVGPWLATVMASLLVLFGAGREDIIWGFQVGFTGAMFFALLQLVLADHDGPFGRRDVLAIGVGVLAVMSASPAIPLILVAGVALLVRHGWRAAALQTVPLGIGYVIWRTLTDAEQSSPFGRPGIDVVLDWLRSGTVATYDGLAGGSTALAWALPAILLIGLATALVSPTDDHDAGKGRFAGGLTEARRIATPLALLASPLVFMLLSVQARWVSGPDAAAASRYLYFYVVATVPALSVGIAALARRWRPAGVLLGLAIFAVSVPPNVRAFDEPPFGPAFHRERRLLVVYAPRVPWARDVPRDARPVVDMFVGDDLDMGFILDAVAAGRLTPGAGHVPPHIRDELYVRLGTRQRQATAFPESCERLEPGLRLEPDLGETYILTGDVNVWGYERGRRSNAPTLVRASEGSELTIARDGLDLQIEPVGDTGGICQVGSP